MSLTTTLELPLTVTSARLWPGLVFEPHESDTGETAATTPGDGPLLHPPEATGPAAGRFRGLGRTCRVRFRG